jgi:hypothetical protein
MVDGDWGDCNLIDLYVPQKTPDEESSWFRSLIDTGPINYRTVNTIYELLTSLKTPEIDNLAGGKVPRLEEFIVRT